MGRSLSILVVDDQPDVRTLVRLMLGPIGVEIEEAANGEAALQAVCDREFNVIISDNDMPRMSGAEFHRAACKVRKGLGGRFIFITGGDTTDLKALGRPIIQKPFDPKELLDEVRRILERDGTGSSDATLEAVDMLSPGSQRK